MASRAEDPLVYTEWRYLRKRSGHTQEPAIPIPGGGPLLVAEPAILRYEDNRSPYGFDAVRIYPAIYEGKRAWVIRESWNHAQPGVAQVTQERILYFEAGVKLLIERGYYEFPQPTLTVAYSHDRAQLIELRRKLVLWGRDHEENIGDYHLDASTDETMITKIVNTVEEGWADLAVRLLSLIR